MYAERIHDGRKRRLSAVSNQRSASGSAHWGAEGVARDLEWLDPESHETLEALVIEVKRMLASLIRKLRPD